MRAGRSTTRNSPGCYSNAAGVYDEPDYGDVVADSPVAEYADFYSDEFASAEDSLESQGADAWAESMASEEEAESTSDAAADDQAAATPGHRLAV